MSWRRQRRYPGEGGAGKIWGRGERCELQARENHGQGPGHEKEVPRHHLSRPGTHLGLSPVFGAVDAAPAI